MGRERIIGSESEMVSLGQRVGAALPPGSVLALSGDLGAGKTTFVQGLALGLGISAPVLSPTFVYLNQYSGSLPLFHFDLYRMKNLVDFLGLGFEEYFDREGICAIEWPQRISPILPPHTLHISFSHQTEGRVASFSSLFPKNLIDSLPYLCD